MPPEVPPGDPGLFQDLLVALPLLDAGRVVQPGQVLDHDVALDLGAVGGGQLDGLVGDLEEVDELVAAVDAVGGDQGLAAAVHDAGGQGLGAE